MSNLQLFQSLKDGSTHIIDTPVPSIKDKELLIKSKCSLISVGTERMLVDFAKSNWIDRAKKQPDKVKEVLDKVKSDGFLSTYDAIKSKIDQPIPLGYCNVGVVLEKGKNVSNSINIGDVVVSNSSHSEFVIASENLCAKVPKGLSVEKASFTVLASIGLQGIRLANPTLGETFVVSGLGIIGLLTAQLLKNNGCKVLGLDTDKKKCELAESLGIKSYNLTKGDNPEKWCLDANGGQEIDGFIITASTESSEPIHIAAKACRKRGRIILVGVTGINIRRDLFYKKELLFQVSCSYGPGRYDKNYEEKNNDYPFGFVRWTEKRNFEAVLSLLNNGNILINPLISERFLFKNAKKAYESLIDNKNILGIILNYENNNCELEKTIKLSNNTNSIQSSQALIGIIGIGNHSRRTLIPAFKKAGANLHTLVAKNGLYPTYFGNKFGFKFASSNLDELLKNKECNSFVISTRHDSHFSLLKKAIENKKHVYLEKPLCLTRKQLNEIKKIYDGSSILMLGYNRRFSPLVKVLKEKLTGISGPKSFIYTINSGFIPLEHWTQDPLIGGGRLLGEACHFLDLIRYLVSSPIKSATLKSICPNNIYSDTFSIHVQFDDNSIASINYFSNGHKSYPKENLDVFADKKIFRIENFRKLKGWGINGFAGLKLTKQDKGINNSAKEFLKSINNTGKNPIDINEIYEVQDTLFDLMNL